MREIGVGLVGAGTVGQGLLEILKNSKDSILARSGVLLNLVSVCDKNPEVVRNYPEIPFTSDYKELLTNPKIQVIVELVGGTGIAYNVVKEALAKGKTVVTANKALLSEKGKELFQLAKENGVEIGFEAAVAGTIPIIRSIKTGLIANEFLSLYGILNGTTNFILTKMEEDNLDYHTALKLAQDLGFAEKDPSFDVEGIDAAHKVSLLAGLAFGKSISIEDMYVEGISKVSRTEILFAKELGYRIKLLGICKQNGEEVEARVHPTMVPLTHPIAGIANEMNAVYAYTNYSGPLMFSGKGAGSLPTASAVVSDLVHYSTRLGSMGEFSENNLFPKAKLIPTSEAEERFYLRFNTIDRPGVIASISQILGKNGISISSVRQHETKIQPVEVIFLTHKAKEASVRRAIQEIDETGDYIQESSVMMRLEELP